MKIGYIRVSKDKQATILQEDAMKREECKRVFTDKMTGKRFDRPEYLRMLDLARPGDVIVVWRLDRLGRSLKELIETVTDLAARGIELKSLKENIDTTTPTGKFMFHIMAALTEFERDLISERTQAGLEAARARGRKGGRPAVTKNMSVAALSQARELYTSQRMSVAEIMRRTGFRSRTTFYKYVVNAEKQV
ncbi:resolvase [Ktedonobacteria bacterium brp13]|nr:resolvase [Ktedonobacteria bacterium brp13]